MPESDQGGEDAFESGSKNGYCGVLENLVDSLEIDLNSEVEKNHKTDKELTRLKEHLMHLDSELTEEVAKRDQLVAFFKARILELQNEVAFWRKTHEEMTLAMEDESDTDSDKNEDEILERIEGVQDELIRTQRSLESETKKSEELLQELQERDRVITDLQVALQQLECNTKREIEIGTAESKARLEQAEQQVRQLQREVDDVKAENSAIPDLKKKIYELDIQLEKQRNQDAPREVIDKELVANLLLNLFDRSKNIDRRSVAEMLCNLVGICDPEDRQKMGLVD